MPKATTPTAVTAVKQSTSDRLATRHAPPLVSPPPLRSPIRDADARAAYCLRKLAAETQKLADYYERNRTYGLVPLRELDALVDWLDGARSNLANAHARRDDEDAARAAARPQ